MAFVDFKKVKETVSIEQTARLARASNQTSGSRVVAPEPTNENPYHRKNNADPDPSAHFCCPPSRPLWSSRACGQGTACER
jgi:hypothetical protein